MVKSCNYSSPVVEEKLVRDHFIMGLLDRELSDKLCQNPEMTLQEALMYVRQHEDENNKRKAGDSEASSFAFDATRKRKQAQAVNTTQQLYPF